MIAKQMGLMQWVVSTSIAGIVMVLALIGFTQSSFYSQAAGRTLEERVTRAEVRQEKSIERVEKKVDKIYDLLSAQH